MADKKQQQTKAKKPKPAPSPPDEEQKDDKKKPSRDNKGRFVKGHKKEGGRQLGTKNKFGNIRDRLKEQLEPILQELAINLLKIQKEEGTNEMLKTADIGIAVGDAAPQVREIADIVIGNSFEDAVALYLEEFCS